MPTIQPATEQLEVLFTWIDYTIFFLMLLSSACIGIFHGYFSQKKEDENSTEEFLMAGKSMNAFPIAMSLIASFMSAIALLGTPSEVYRNGMVYYLIGVAYILVVPATSYLYLPVFWEMQLTSAYEYLEVRFNPHVRRLGSAIFIIQMVLYMAIVVYAPSLALSQVTGINLYLSICLICLVCVFYTTIGGMKAVLWTDTLQVVIMYFVVIFIAIYGTIAVGGIGFVWEKAVESHRVEWVNMDPNPTTRHTFWTLVIGGYFTWIAIYGVNQAQVQRYLCVKEIGMARKALWINAVGLCILVTTVAYMGLVMYAKYWDCDPIRSGVVSAGDQLFPLFVMETMGQFKGLPGLFVAGIFSGALSTVSSGMNSLAAITLEDFIRGACYPDISVRSATLVSKILSLTFGLVTLAMVFVAQRLGNVLSAALAIFGIVGGPLLGMFTLGMFFPWANGVGCFAGTIVSMVFTFWIGIGQQMAKFNGLYSDDPKPTSVAGCGHAFNETLASTAATAGAEQSVWDMELFQLSYMWFSAVGCCTTIVAGLLVSLATGKQDVRKVNPKMLSPAFRYCQKYLPWTKGLGEDYVDSKGDPNSQSSILLVCK